MHGIYAPCSPSFHKSSQHRRRIGDSIVRNDGELIYLSVLFFRSNPSTQSTEKLWHIRLLGEVHGLQALAHLRDLKTRRTGCDTKVLHVQLLEKGSLDLSGQNVCAKVRFLAESPTKADSINGVQRLNHAIDSLQATCHVGLGLGQSGNDKLGEVQEELVTVSIAQKLFERGSP